MVLMERLYRGIGYLSVAGGVVAGLAIFALIFGSTADAVWRAFTGRGIRGVVETGELFLVLASFLGIAYAYRVGSHVVVDSVLQRLPRRLARYVEIAGVLLSAALVLWLVGTAVPATLESIRVGEYRFGVVSVPVWPGRLAIVLGLALLLLELLAELWRLIADTQIEEEWKVVPVEAGRL